MVTKSASQAPKNKHEAQSVPPAQAPPKDTKWDGTIVLRTARSRMRELINDNNARIQAMLAALLVEAGWSEKEFLDALVHDIAVNGREKWQVPTPSLSPALPGSLEGERGASTQPPPRRTTLRPPRTRSGVMSKVDVPKHKKAAG